jgi:steroid delta-isomerase-like uncharacterized protein
MENIMRRIIVAATLAAVLPLLALGQATAKVKRNQDVIRQQYEFLNRGDLKAAASYFTEETKHQGRPVTRESRLRALEDIYNTFPDWHMEIVEMVAEGDSVVVRCTVSGTHRGVGKLAVNGGMLVGVPPTQKHFEVPHIHWYKLRDGKIIESYPTRDDLGMMRQLGLLPPVAQPNPR